MIEILRMKQVVALTKLPRSTVYDLVRSGSFPKPIKLGPQASGWTSDQIQDWIKERVAAAKQGGAA